MKKVLLTGAALMLAGGMVSTASAAAVEPGVKITGDARVRLWYMSEEYSNLYGNKTGYASREDMDSRIRLNVQGTAAGGAYAKARIRITDSSMMGDLDTDTGAIGTTVDHDNIWADVALVGIPFNDTFTLELGRWRSTYGPLPTTYNFFYDDVNLSGLRGIIKFGDIEVNPFIEWMEEAQSDLATSTDKNFDNDEMRFGAHVKAKLNKDWTIGGMLGYQTDQRAEVINSFKPNEGFFGSVYANGKVDKFAIVGEFAVTDSDLNGMNAWYNDGAGTTYYYVDSATAALKAGTDKDEIGSEDTGFGGYIFPNYQIDKLNIGLNLGFTDGGFIPDRAFGFVMLGATDNSKITNYVIGKGGDWMWAGLVASYQINESLKLTGNVVYADIDPWSKTTEGPLGALADSSVAGTDNLDALDSAWELSAVLQYTISKGADVYFSAGYLSPEFELASNKDDGAFGALTRFELKF